MKISHVLTGGIVGFISSLAVYEILGTLFSIGFFGSWLNISEGSLISYIGLILDNFSILATVFTVVGILVSLVVLKKKNP